MSVGSIIAAVGGAAAGVDSRLRYDDAQKQQLKLEHMREMIQALQIDSADRRSAAMTGLGYYKTDVGATTAADKNATTVATAGQRDATTRRGQDLKDSQFWDGSVPLSYQRDATAARGQDLRDAEAWGNIDLGWSRDATARRGQDIGSADRRYGIDTTASTAMRGQDIGAETSRGNAALASSTSQRNADLASSTSQRNTDQRAQNPWGNLFAPGANINVGEPPAAGGAPAAVAPAPAATVPQVQPPARVMPPAAAPVAPRGAPSPALAPAPAPAVAGPKPGDVITVRGGRRIRITKVYPDGTFDGAEAK